MNEPLTDGIPTQERRDAWIHAFRQVGEYQEPTDRTGKWLIWLVGKLSEGLTDFVLKGGNLH